MQPDGLGPRLTSVLSGIWEAHRAIHSNFVRENGPEVAALASLGLITTKITTGAFGRIWRITPQGMKVLNGHF